MLPKLTKPNYMISPSMPELARMSAKELSKVKNFTIWNKHGKVVFEGETDLVREDIDLNVIIKHKHLDIYPSDIYTG